MRIVSERDFEDLEQIIVPRYLYFSTNGIGTPLKRILVFIAVLILSEATVLPSYAIIVYQT